MDKFTGGDAIGHAGSPAQGGGVWELLITMCSQMLPGVESGGKVGVLPKQQLAVSGGEMVVWEKTDAGVVASRQAFQGFRGTNADLLFVADEDALLNLWGDSRKDPIKKLREGIRNGSVMLYFLRSKKELLDLGYEDMVDQLGLPLAGCR